MCVPVVLGVVTAAVGAVGAIAQYQQQQAQVAAANDAAWQQTLFQNRQIDSQANYSLQNSIFQMNMHNQQVNYTNQQTLQNAILQTDQTMRGNLRMHQEWQDALVRNEYQNLSSELDYTSKLNQSILSRNAADVQKQISQRGLNQDLIDAQRKLRDAQAMAAFEAEKLMAGNLKATGSVLATGRTGQSIGIAVQSLDAAYGRDLSMNKVNFQNRLEDFYSETMNAYMKKVAVDSEAMSKIIPEPVKPIDLPAPSAPIYASMPEMPVFAPMMTNPGPQASVVYAPAPIKQPGPSGLGLVAGIGSSVIGGIQTGYQMNSLINQPGGQ